MSEKRRTDEKPLRLKAVKPSKGKRKQPLPGLKCIIHFDRNKSDTKTRPISTESFKKVQEVATLRQSQKNVCYRLDDICAQIPGSYCPHTHGIHRWCYSNFTNTSILLKRQHPVDDHTATSSPKQRRTSGESSSRLLPADKCLFCDKNRIKKLTREENLVKCLTKTSEQSIKTAAETRQDLDILRKVQGVDLVAKEAHYHPSCRKQYTRTLQRHQQSNKDSKSIEEQNAHKAAFEYISKHVKESIIDGCNVERMSMLRERYLQFILEKSPQVYNANYKTDKLKSKLVKEFGTQLQFWQPNYLSELVYSAVVPKGRAIESAFEIAASESKRLEESAFLLRRTIHSAHNEAQPMPWPPSSDILIGNTIHPPQSLQDFIECLITGKKMDNSSAKTQRLTLSFSQDICQAVTRGTWTMPKHLLLGMTLRHLTGSAQVVTLINRLGHCASYTCLLELETAMCKHIDERDSVIPSTVSPQRNIVTHLCWDNFDMREETPSGAGTTHTAHGIIIQETLRDNGDVPSEIPATLPKTKDRSVTCKTTEIGPCFSKDKTEPCLTTTTTVVLNTEASASAKSSDMLWVCSRAVFQLDTQKVPSWAGWVSLTEGNVDETNPESTVDYMAPVFAPVTDNATVQHIMHLSQAASREVGQQYTIVTFDLAVAKKAYSLVWQHQQVFSDVIVRMGAFHLTCSYMGALGKSLRCSGFEEILVESGICASGSIEKVMSGKHYNRAVRVHKIVLEALERLLLQMFESSQDELLDTDERRGILIRLAENPCKQTLSDALANEECSKMLSLFSEFKGRVRQGKMGKTPQFWLYYMDKVWLMLQFQRATKENNLDLHLASLQQMCSLFFSYDHPNYARYTTVYLLTLLNLPESHPGAEDLLRRNGFSVNRSEVPSSRNAVDITIEQTINRHAKSHGGIVGFSRNHSAYYRWCMTRHARASYCQASMEMADMDSQDCSTHKDLRPSQITRSEDDTRKVLQAIRNFINPFEVENKDVLYCLSSGAPATKDIEHDLLRAVKVGKEAYDHFVQERLLDKTKSFNAPIKKNNLKTFANQVKSAKVTGQSKKSKQITAERNVFGQLVLLALEHDISMERVLSFPLGPVPWALATADGTPVKTDKAKLMHSLEGEEHTTKRPTQGTTSYIMDGNALLQAQVALPGTFGELAESLFKQLPHNSQRVDFVTDSYLPLSIKGLERARRGSANAHLIKGPLTKIPRNWKTFLASEENKQSFTRFLLNEWKGDKYAPRLIDKKILFVCEKQCICLTSQNGENTQSEEMTELYSTQEEADTKIILHCLHIAADSPEDSTIIVRSPDTDVFVLLLKFTQEVQQKILFDTGVGNKRRLVDVKGVINEVGMEMCSALPALHAFTGCDSTSAFVRKGKLMPLKTLKDHPEYLGILSTLGQSPEIEDHVFERLEHFTCLLYRGSATKDINKLRHEKFVERFSVKQGKLLSSYSGVDMSLLPPCRESLKMHVRRANYQALIWYHADKAVPDIPPAEGNGWKVVDGKLEYTWAEGELMPKELVEVLVEQPDAADEEEESGIEETSELLNLMDVIFESDD